jgi:hypothetical protein
MRGIFPRHQRFRHWPRGNPEGEIQNGNADEYHLQRREKMGKSHQLITVLYTYLLCNASVKHREENGLDYGSGLGLNAVGHECKMDGERVLGQVRAKVYARTNLKLQELALFWAA